MRTGAEAPGEACVSPAGFRDCGNRNACGRSGQTVALLSGRPCWLTHTQHTPLASVQGQAGSPACTQPRVAPGPALLLDAFLTHRECLGLWVLAPHGGREPKHDVARPGFHQEREHRKTLPSKLWNFSGYFIVIKEKEKKQ